MFLIYNFCFFFFFNDPATTEIYTLSLHDALPICAGGHAWVVPHDDGIWRLAADGAIVNAKLAPSTMRGGAPCDVPVTSCPLPSLRPAPCCAAPQHVRSTAPPSRAAGRGRQRLPAPSSSPARRFRPTPA